MMVTCIQSPNKNPVYWNLDSKSAQHYSTDPQFNSTHHLSHVIGKIYPESNAGYFIQEQALRDSRLRREAGQPEKLLQPARPTFFSGPSNWAALTHSRFSDPWKSGCAITLKPRRPKKPKMGPRCSAATSASGFGLRATWELRLRHLWVEQYSVEASRVPSFALAG